MLYFIFLKGRDSLEISANSTEDVAKSQLSIAKLQLLTLSSQAIEKSKKYALRATIIPTKGLVSYRVAVTANFTDQLMSGP